MRVFLVAAFAALLSTSAFAQESDDARARELFQLGDDHYAAGRYEDALAAFEEAHALSGRPLLLFNMANVQERMGRYDDAIVSLERYLPDASADEEARVRSRLESLRRRAERVRSLSAEEAQADAEAEAQTIPEEPEEAPPAESGGVRISPLGLTLIAGGGAVLIGGLSAALIASGARSDLDERCTSGASGRFCETGAQGAADRDRRASIAADVLFVAGAASLAAGVLVWVLSDEEEPADTVQAGVQPGGAYAEWRHAF